MALQVKMTIDECIEFAQEWSRGMTLHEGSQGWRVVCLLLAQEVERLRAQSTPVEGQSVTHGQTLVPVEVLNLYNFMCAAFTPMTPQQEQIAISLDLAKSAMLGAPQPQPSPSADGSQA